MNVRVTAFTSAVDSLLAAGRSDFPTQVLVPMKAVVDAVTAIIDDLRQLERGSLSNGVDIGVLRFLKGRAEATLSDLVVTTEEHATSAGLSPVCLLDAAASHVSSTITEIAKVSFVRGTTPAEEERFRAMQPATNGHTPGRRFIDDPSSPTSPAQIYTWQTNGMASGDSTAWKAPEDAWNELKVMCTGVVKNSAAGS